ncbi:hypothetical protein DFP72DRAFT_826415, partial [Ephemerocybe angulata]
MTISSTTKTADDEKLNGPDDYQIWRVRLKQNLMKFKVWGVVSGTDPKPGSAAQSPPATTTSPGSDQATETDALISASNATALQEWNVRNERALGLILESVSNAIALELDSHETAKDAFDAVVKKYEKTNIGSTAFSTLLELIDLRWTGATPFSDHISDFYTLNARL